MEKTYFIVRPSEFTRLGEIDWDGNVEEVQCNDFKVANDRENVMIFEACYDDYYLSGHREFAKYAKEFVSGKKFELQVRDSKRGPRYVALGSDELGLYMKQARLLDDVEVDPLKVSGLIMYLQKNPEEREEYYYQLKEMFETAKSFKTIYDNCLYGPSRYMTKETRRSFKRTR